MWPSCLPALLTAWMPFPADDLALLSLLEMLALRPLLGVPAHTKSECLDTTSKMAFASCK